MQQHNARLYRIRKLVISVQIFVLLGDLTFDYVIEQSLCSNPVKHETHIEELFACRQLRDKATRVSQNRATLLHYYFNTVYERYTKAGVIKSGLRDHHLVFTIMSYKDDTSQANTALVRYFNILMK